MANEVFSLKILHKKESSNQTFLYNWTFETNVYRFLRVYDEFNGLCIKKLLQTKYKVFLGCFQCRTQKIIEIRRFKEVCKNIAISNSYNIFC